MKKFLILLFCIVFAFSLCACKKSEDTVNGNSENSQTSSMGKESTTETEESHIDEPMSEEQIDSYSGNIEEDGKSAGDAQSKESCTTSENDTQSDGDNTDKSTSSNVQQGDGTDSSSDLSEIWTKDY